MYALFHELYTSWLPTRSTWHISPALNSRFSLFRFVKKKKLFKKILSIKYEKVIIVLGVLGKRFLESSHFLGFS